MIDVIVDTLALEFGAKVKIHPAFILDDLKRSVQLRKELYLALRDIHQTGNLSQI